jgi:hypothetical protein
MGRTGRICCGLLRVNSMMSTRSLITSLTTVRTVHGYRKQKNQKVRMEQLHKMRDMEVCLLVFVAKTASCRPRWLNNFLNYAPPCFPCCRNCKSTFWVTRV